MHVQSSLVLSLTAATALASTASVAPTGSSASSNQSSSPYHYGAGWGHIADLQSEIASLKSQIASYSAASSETCGNAAATASVTGSGSGDVPPSDLPSGAVSRASSSGSDAPATYTAAYDTFSSAYSDAQTSTYSVLSSTSQSSADALPTESSADASTTESSADASSTESSADASSTESSADASSTESSADASSTESSAQATSTESSAQATSDVSSSSSASPSSEVSSSATSATSASSDSSTTSSASATSSSAVSTALPVLADYSGSEIASGDAWKDVAQKADARMQARESSGSCTYETARVRREFRSMSNADRKAFTDAIACLQSTAPRYTSAGSDTYPGVQSRYDEFVATHINMTYIIHGTADFLAWHRNFIHEFESDLVDTCGYTGTLPYWDWARDAQAVDESEIFNGDEFSMGSNGEYISGRDDTYLGLQDLTFPPGTGGGCVQTGPFSEGNYETNLGPLDSPYGNNVANQFDYNPRCLVRDLNSWFSSRFNTYNNVTDLVLGQPEIGNFQALMQGFLGDNKLGVHGGGHWLGGGPSQLEDFHSSPGDPVFFIHHAMIDRIWTVWQNLNFDARMDEIEGTSTLLNSPPTAEMSLSDTISFGLVSGDQTFSDLMNTMEGAYCYRYE